MRGVRGQKRRQRQAEAVHAHRSEGGRAESKKFGVAEGENGTGDSRPREGDLEFSSGWLLTKCQRRRHLLVTELLSAPAVVRSHQLVLRLSRLGERRLLGKSSRQSAH
eukprot:1156108-Pleurochrysis_carterae.AAC.1